MEWNDAVCRYGVQSEMEEEEGNRSATTYFAEQQGFLHHLLYSSMFRSDPQLTMCFCTQHFIFGSSCWCGGTVEGGRLQLAQGTACVPGLAPITDWLGGRMTPQCCIRMAGLPGLDVLKPGVFSCAFVSGPGPLLLTAGGASADRALTTHMQIWRSSG